MPLAISGLIGGGEIDHLLAEELCPILRDDDLIRDDVIDEVGSARSRKAEIVNLDGRGPEGEKLGAPVLAETREVDNDIDLHPAHALSNIEVAFIAHV